jgi:hypothetical protein
MQFLLFLFILLVAVHCQETCFDDHVCVDLRADASAATRARFWQACASGNLWQDVAWCQLYANATTRILDLTAANNSRLFDLTAVFLYSRGGSVFGSVNTALRHSGGVNVPAKWRDQLVLTGSGLSALRQSPTFGDVGPKIVWRAEEPFAGSVCNFSSTANPFQTLSGSMNVTGFESTSTSLSLVDYWPFGAGASRVISIYRADPQADGGTFLNWLESPFQREVTFPPPVTLHLLACEQMPKTAVAGLRKDTAVLYAVLTTVTAPSPSPSLRAKALAALRKAFVPALTQCDELVCQFMCADRSPPQACSCVSATQCAPTGSGVVQAMRIINEDWVVGFLTQGNRPTCLTNLNSADGNVQDRFGMSECSSALVLRQSFVFLPVPGSDLVTIRFRNSSGLCLSNMSGRFLVGDNFGLWYCNNNGAGSADQMFRLAFRYNEFAIQSALTFSSTPPAPIWCAMADRNRLDADVTFQQCSDAHTQNFNAVPADFHFAHRR